MQCHECEIAKDFHSYTLFNRKCKWCGARLVQVLGTLDRSAAEIKRRRSAALDDWEQMGHDRAEVRSLAMGALALEGNAVAENDPLKKRRKRSSAARQSVGV